MSKSQVIPFRFEAREVRTLLIDDQPWFVAADVAAALNYRMAADMTRNLDDDERGTQIVRTPSGHQEMTIINESGLYSAILRSRKAEAKRFKKWITAEVLPAIRRHGRYEDHHNRMATLVGEALGVTELVALKGVIADKAKQLPKEKRLSFKHTMHNRLHTRFNVPRTELIPHESFADACNFVAAYAVEGEYLACEKAEPSRFDIHHPVESLLVGRRIGMIQLQNADIQFLNVTLNDLREFYSSPCEQILGTLAEAGYDVEGAWWELRTYRNKLAYLMPLIENLSAVAMEPQQYVVNRQPDKRSD